MRQMEIKVPSDLMLEVADLIEENEIDNSIMGADDELIVISVSYHEQDRSIIMEILELIEDHDDNDEDDDDDNDN